MWKYNWGGPTAREFPVFPAYHQSHGSGITRPLYNKKEGGIDPEGTDEQVIEVAHRASTGAAQ